MDIIRTLLFIFIVNNPTAANKATSSDPAFLGTWREVEVIEKVGNKLKYNHQQKLYYFDKKGTVLVSSREGKESVRWIRKDGSLFLLMPVSGQHLPFTVRFVDSTVAAHRLLETEKAAKAVLLIQAMKDDHLYGSHSDDYPGRRDHSADRSTRSGDNYTLGRDNLIGTPRTGVSGTINVRGRRVVYSPAMVLPEKYKQRGLSFYVTIAVTVSPEGLVTTASIVGTTGDPELDGIVVQFARRYRLEPISSGQDQTGTISFHIRPQ